MALLRQALDYVTCVGVSAHFFTPCTGTMQLCSCLSVHLNLSDACEKKHSSTACWLAPNASFPMHLTGCKWIGGELYTYNLLLVGARGEVRVYELRGMQLLVLQMAGQWSTVDQVQCDCHQHGSNKIIASWICQLQGLLCTAVSAQSNCKPVFHLTLTR